MRQIILQAPTNRYNPRLRVFVGAAIGSNAMAGLVRNYVSAHTTWMSEQMDKHPEWAAEQKAGRSLWWDRPQTVDETTRDAQSKVANKAYPYDTNFEF